MSNLHTKRTIEALETMIAEMQFLVEHPRMQQKRWVAKGKTWLPVLHNAKEDLAIESYRAIMAVFERLGLSIRKRDAKTWGYSWNGEALKGAFPSIAETMEAALKERLDSN